MRILLAFHPINNPGGIINHAEDLMAGFKELGHEVDMMEFVYTDKTPRNKTVQDSTGFVQGEVLKVHQGKGWLWTASKRLPYKRKEARRKWREEIAPSYDLIIWQTPVVTCQGHMKGNTVWPELYDHGTPQIGIIHDGNFARSYPHLYHIKQHFVGLACVHPCAFHGCDIDLPRSMILNPQRIDRAQNTKPYNQRRKGFLSCQTFKAWKHVDDLIRAIPHIHEDIEKTVAGGGIEWNYMTSDGKCKPHYYDALGRRIWDVALDSGMEFLGYITHVKRDEILADVRTLIDPSWSINYNAIGDHFNRVVVDAIIAGAIPIATNLGMSNNVEGIGEVFKPGEHYIMVPYNASPQEFADIVNHANNLPDDEAEELRFNGRELLKNFDHRVIAQQYIDLANRKNTGFHNKTVKRKNPNPDLEEKSDKIMYEFFKVEKKDGNQRA